MCTTKLLILCLFLLQSVLSLAPGASKFTQEDQRLEHDVPDSTYHLRHRKLPALSVLKGIKTGVVGTVVSLLYFQWQGLDLMLQILKLREPPCSDLSQDAILEASQTIVSSSEEVVEPDALLVMMGMLNVAVTAIKCGAGTEEAYVAEMAIVETRALEYMDTESSSGVRRLRFEHMVGTVKQGTELLQLLDASTSLSDLLSKLQQSDASL